jgi:hypothetical protein
VTKRKARFILTTACHRDCDGCCNKSDIYERKEVYNLSDLKAYDEVLITGGEPMLYPNKVSYLLYMLSEVLGYTGTKYLYSAYFSPEFYSLWSGVLKRVDGLHYTLHAECTDKDVEALKTLSRLIGANFDPAFTHQSFRLAIDKRVYERYDLSNLNLAPWTVVRKMEWKAECPLPEGEELIVWKGNTL